jgi:hypothetical protein
VRYCGLGIGLWLVGGTTPCFAAEVLPVGVAVPGLQVRVGESLQYTLVDVEGRATAWAVEGGPPGLFVSPDGTLDLAGAASDVGLWRANLLLWWDGSWSRRVGVDVVVLAEPTRVPVATDLARALDLRVGQPLRPLPLAGCSFMVGAAGGYSSAGQSWVLVGTRGTGSASPIVGASCDGGRTRGLAWSGGIDVAPGVRFVAATEEVRHVLAATVAVGWTNGTWFVGGYGTAGATLIGLGPIGRWMPFRLASGARQGLELRAAWVPAGRFSAEAVVAWTFQLGARPSPEAASSDQSAPATERLRGRRSQGNPL